MFGGWLGWGEDAPRYSELRIPALRRRIISWWFGPIHAQRATYSHLGSTSSRMKIGGMLRKASFVSFEMNTWNNFTWKF